MLFRVTFRPAKDTDAIKAVRALLKIALRRFGLRCVAIERLDDGGRV